MSNVVSRETGREAPPSKEAYLESFEKEWAEIHEGSMPETGLKDKGETKRKETCEDVKLNNIQKGLFLVADGVSSREGWFASRETAKVAYEILGEQLDISIENNLIEALRTGENVVDRITTHVGAQMIAAVEQAHLRILAMAVHPEFKGASTTLSLTKLVELPNGKGGHIQRLFFTNVGDSRIYVQQGDQPMRQITRDDSFLNMYVDQDDVTPEEARTIDQSEGTHSLDRNLRPFARKRNIITKAIGHYKPTENLEVSFLDLQPGDRFAIVSDGVSDQLLETQIAEILAVDQDDSQTEDELQGRSMQMSLEGTSKRSKGDDIAAIVRTIEERGPSREYLKPAEKKLVTKEILLARQEKLKQALSGAKDRVRRAETALANVEPMTLKRDKILLMEEKEKALEQEALYAYHIEKTHLDLLDQEIPPRFESGAQVQVWREDFQTPGLDPQTWTVVGYDKDAKAYSVRGAGGAERELSRYELERVQGGRLAMVGDVMMAQVGEGRFEKGFKIESFDTDGSVVLVKERTDIIKRSRMSGKDVQDKVLASLYQGHRAKQRMDHATQKYHEALTAQEKLTEEREAVLQLESRQEALNRSTSGE